jgi:hypothetical protein
MTGTGEGVTVTGYTVGVAAVQPFALIKLTLTV